MVSGADAQEGRLDELGKAATVEVGFQYRVRPEATEFTSRPWTAPALTSLAAPGVFKQEINRLEPVERYQFQALIKHPLPTLTAKEVALTVPAN